MTQGCYKPVGTASKTHPTEDPAHSAQIAHISHLSKILDITEKDCALVHNIKDNLDALLLAADDCVKAALS